MISYDPRFRSAPRGSRFALVALCVFVLAAGVKSEAVTLPEEPEIESLRREIEMLRADYESRLADLETRLAGLESSRAAAGAGDDVEALRAEARAASTPIPTEPTIGHERNLNRLNPEISFTGDVVALARGSDRDFDAREFELDLQASLDPFSSTKWTLSFGEEEVEVEEGYVSYSGLAGGLGLRAGKMRQTFGALNRSHLHALPQVDYPLVLRSFFGEEGLAQTGLSLDWLIPRPWASANELTFQLTDGSSEPFGGESFDELVALLHLKNYWDLSPDVYFEWGLSGIVGSPESGRDTRVWGSDVTLHWQPASRAKYRELTWRTEVLRSDRDDEAGVRRASWGGYSYVEGLLRRNLYVGLRHDHVENPLDPSLKIRASEPYISWWQSEYVRLRAALQRVEDDLTDETDHRVYLQVTWAAGPHKHESY